MNAIEAQRLDLVERTSGRIQELVCKYWELLEHPELTKMVLTTLPRHKLVLKYLHYLYNIPVGKLEIKLTGVLCGMLPNDDTLLPTLSQLFELADYATISICSQLCSLYQRPELLLFLDTNVRRIQMHRSGGTMLKNFDCGRRGILKMNV